MDKGEGLEQRSIGWERAKRRHIDMGAYQKKFLRKAMKKKNNEKKEEEVEIVFT